MTYLDEHLNQIYITEDISQVIASMKGKVKNLSGAFSMGNLKKAKDIMDTIPDISSDELMTAIKRKGSKYYTQASKISRGDKTPLQKAFIGIYASLLAMQDSLPESSKPTLDEALEKLRDWADRNAGNFMAQGFYLTIVMWFIAFFVYSVPIIGSLAATGVVVGMGLFWFGVFLLIIKIFLNTYFSLRGKKV